MFWSFLINHIFSILETYWARFLYPEISEEQVRYLWWGSLKRSGIVACPCVCLEFVSCRSYLEDMELFQHFAWSQSFRRHGHCRSGLFYDRCRQVIIQVGEYQSKSSTTSRIRSNTGQLSPKTKWHPWRLIKEWITIEKVALMLMEDWFQLCDEAAGAGGDSVRPQTGPLLWGQGCQPMRGCGSSRSHYRYYRQG